MFGYLCWVGYMRKKIGFITICPESDSQQNTFRGVFSQCAKYNYDVLVFSPLVHSSHFNKVYLKGELNIYNLINFDELDAVIVTPISMEENGERAISESVCKLLEEKCKKPVIALNEEFGKYTVLYSDDCSSMEYITNHVLNVHHCKKIDVLTGPASQAVSLERVRGIKKAMEAHGLTLTDDHLFFGDFWYSSGEMLADKYLSGELELPDAIICTSDHMAIGISEALTECGIKVPGQVVVTGFGGTRDADMAIPTITSYLSGEDITAAEAVNRIRELIEPGLPVLPPTDDKSEKLCIGSSCGCQEDTRAIRFRLRNHLFSSPRGTEERASRFGVDYSTMIDSYSSEIFTSTDSVRNCLEKMYESKYLLKPYSYSYICVTENWLDSRVSCSDGYPERMNLVLNTENPSKHSGYDTHIHYGAGNEHFFETKQMLPALYEEYGEPHVYYFVPLHVNDITLGYFVLQSTLECENLIDNVFHGYIRNINNGLEMTRAKYRITRLSESDLMTGLLNRRGMESHVAESLQGAAPDANIFAIVLDMDGLKHTNDTYGHAEGDLCISALGRAIAAIKDPSEIAVRGGGDEFYLIGIGNYNDEIAAQKVAALREKLLEENEKLSGQTKPSASIGYAILPTFTPNCLDRVLDFADNEMYKEKHAKKEQRKENR